MDAVHSIIPIATVFAMTESGASCHKFLHHIFFKSGLGPALHGFVCIVDRSSPHHHPLNSRPVTLHRHLSLIIMVCLHCRQVIPKGSPTKLEAHHLAQTLLTH